MQTKRFIHKFHSFEFVSSYKVGFSLSHTQNRTDSIESDCLDIHTSSRMVRAISLMFADLFAVKGVCRLCLMHEINGV